MSLFNDKKDNDPFNVPKPDVSPEPAPKPVVQPEKTVSSDVKTIENIVGTGKSVEITGKSGVEYNELYAMFTKQRKAGELRMSYCHASQTITAVGLKDEETDTKL